MLKTDFCQKRVMQNTLPTLEVKQDNKSLCHIWKLSEKNCGLASTNNDLQSAKLDNV